MQILTLYDVGDTLGDVSSEAARWVVMCGHLVGDGGSEARILSRPKRSPRGKRGVSQVLT